MQCVCGGLRFEGSWWWELLLLAAREAARPRDAGYSQLGVQGEKGAGDGGRQNVFHGCWGWSVSSPQ